jgi:hypothetical protein
VISEATDEDFARLAEHWVVADRYVREQCGGQRLQRTEADLALLQSVIDAKVLAPSQTFELQCLGVAFGMIVTANVRGLNWAIVNDKYGRDPTIRYRQSTLQFNVLTMIYKRLERGEHADVRAMYIRLRDELNQLKAKVD